MLACVFVFQSFETLSLLVPRLISMSRDLPRLTALALLRRFIMSLPLSRVEGFCPALQASSSISRLGFGARRLHDLFLHLLKLFHVRCPRIFLLELLFDVIVAEELLRSLQLHGFLRLQVIAALRQSRARRTGAAHCGLRSFRSIQMIELGKLRAPRRRWRCALLLPGHR